jgi:GDPmannose 4,6-dehydratase
MLQQDAPADYVIATGKSHSVREFLEIAAAYCGLDWQRHVQTDVRYFRPTEVDHLLGDSTRARRSLCWAPKMSFIQLVHLMVDSDMELARQNETLIKAGHKGIATATFHE